MSSALPACVMLEGMSCMRPAYARAAGSDAITSLPRMVWRRTLCVSTIGLSAVTVTVSSIAPTFSSALIVAVKVPDSSIPSRLKVLKPTSVMVSMYVPGRRSTIRYCPVASVVAVRTFSIRTSLLAATVTPGRTAPDGSLTVPVIEAWAKTVVGRKTNAVSRTTRVPLSPIADPPCGDGRLRTDIAILDAYAGL